MIKINNKLNQEDYNFIIVFSDILLNQYKLSEKQTNKCTLEFKQLLINDPEYIYHYNIEDWAEYVNNIINNKEE